MACNRIIRSHVLSFASLRQIRFGAGPDGDAACRALLAALALNALARSDAELSLRANCDLREAGPAVVVVVVVVVDQRAGDRVSLAPPTVESPTRCWPGLSPTPSRQPGSGGTGWRCG